MSRRKRKRSRRGGAGEAGGHKKEEQKEEEQEKEQQEKEVQEEQQEEGVLWLTVAGHSPSWWGRHGHWESDTAGHREADAGAQSVLHFIQVGNLAYRMMSPGQVFPLH